MPLLRDACAKPMLDVSGLLPSSVSFTRPESSSVVKLVEKSQGEQATQRRLGFGGFSE